jgi:hypothetical protein
MDALGSLALRGVDAYRKMYSARSDRDRGLAARQIETVESEIDDRVFHVYMSVPMIGARWSALLMKRVQ